MAALKARFDRLAGRERVAARPRIVMLQEALEHAHEAAGSGDPVKLAFGPAEGRTRGAMAALQKLERLWG